MKRLILGIVFMGLAAGLFYWLGSHALPPPSEKAPVRDAISPRAAQGNAMATKPTLAQDATSEMASAWGHPLTLGSLNAEESLQLIKPLAKKVHAVMAQYAMCKVVSNSEIVLSVSVPPSVVRDLKEMVFSEVLQKSGEDLRQSYDRAHCLDQFMHKYGEKNQIYIFEGDGPTLATSLIIQVQVEYALDDDGSGLTSGFSLRGAEGLVETFGKLAELALFPPSDPNNSDRTAGDAAK